MPRVRAFVALLLFAAACHGAGGGAPAPTQEPTARLAAASRASPADTAPAATATAAASSASAEVVSPGVCVAHFDEKITARVQLDGTGQGSKGTVEIDGAATRRFDVTVQLYKATAILQFTAYGRGDVAPTGENLTVGKSHVARLVTIDGHDELYFDGDVKLPGVDATKPSRRCASRAAPTVASCNSSKDCAAAEVCVHALSVDGTSGVHHCAKEVRSGNGQGVACLTDTDCADPRLKTIGDIAAYAKQGGLTCQKHDGAAARICRPRP